MNKFFFLMVIVGLCSLHACPQSTQTSASPGNKIEAKSSTNGNANSKPVTLPNGITFHAELTKSLDTSKAKVGDLVNAKITEELSDGTIQIRKGSRLVGHLTKAQAYTKQNGEASLTIAFDKVILSDGQEIAFHGTMEEYQRPTPIIANSISSGVAVSNDASSRAMGRGVDPESGLPYSDTRTSGAAWNSGRGFTPSGYQPQKASGSGFTNKSNFKLESGGLIAVRVQ
ncbi:MAG TPA: hypothetical protein VG759_21190 [Candidatus Angelobacter sp.]|jgi:hypothetical protein|nr:hypothetical protein [Candidatus Angelobacter sp.]